MSGNFHTDSTTQLFGEHQDKNSLNKIFTNITLMGKAIKVEYDMATEYMLKLIMFLAILCIQCNFVNGQFHLNVHQQVTQSVGMDTYNVMQCILSES